MVDAQGDQVVIGASLFLNHFEGIMKVAHFQAEVPDIGKIQFINVLPQIGIGAAGHTAGIAQGVRSFTGAGAVGSGEVEGNTGHGDGGVQ
jgi:hypothetical protein